MRGRQYFLGAGWACEMLEFQEGLGGYPGWGCLGKENGLYKGLHKE